MTSIREMAFHLVKRCFASGYFKATGRALKDEIRKLNQEGPAAKRQVSVIRSKKTLTLNHMDILKPNSQAAIRTKEERMRMTPLSPFGRKIKMVSKAPTPAPRRSKK